MLKIKKVIPFKITISIIILNIFLSLIYIYTSYNSQKEEIIELKKRVTKEIIRDFQTSIDLATLYNKKIINKLLDSYVNEELGMYDVVITDLNRRILCSTNNIKSKYWKFPFIDELVSSKKGLIIRKLDSTTVLIDSYMFNNGNIDKKIGIIEMKVSLKKEYKSIHEFLHRMILVAIASLFVLTLIAIWIARLVSAPLLKLNEAANNVATGNLDVEIDIKSNDEIGNLAKTFSSMVGKLKNIYTFLESEVESRTKDLEEANTKLENLNKQLLEANNAKSAFLASMSHELRTPLNAIIGFSELLRDGFLGELTNEQKEPVNDIYNSGKHLLTLINDILDLSKVEAGKVELVLEDTDLPILLSDALSIVKERAMKHSITLNSEIRKEIGKVKIDSVRVKQIVYNLLSNAVKFTPDKGKVTLLADIVSVFEVLKNKDKCGFTDNLDNISRYSKYIMIGVKDTGIGLPVDKMDRLFKSFEQLHNTNLNKTEGTGLGLSLVKKLVELHNGTVIAESKVFGANKGSTFTVFIPFVVANGSNKLKIADEDKISSIDKHVHKALIVEDDTSSARLLSTYLQDLKFYPEIVYNANDAIKALSKNKYDIVTLDIFLPDKNGWNLLKELKFNNLLNETDVIIISIDPDANKGIILGVADILEKPIQRKEFVNIVNKLKLKKLDTVKNILIVDDDKAVLEYCKKVLNHEFDVECALNGVEAIEKINLKKPDILILDLLMPKMDGFEMVNHIKKDKKYEDIPIIILTNKDLTKDDLRLLNYKIENIIEKSKFNKEIFITEINKVLNKGR